METVWVSGLKDYAVNLSHTFLWWALSQTVKKQTQGPFGATLPQRPRFRSPIAAGTVKAVLDLPIYFLFVFGMVFLVKISVMEPKKGSTLELSRS